MKYNINEDHIITIRNNQSTSKIEIDYVKINNSLSKPLNQFAAICSDPNTELEDILYFLQNTPELNKINSYYSYCSSLTGAYEGFTANHDNAVVSIINNMELFQANFKSDPENFDLKGTIEEYKRELCEMYTLWGKAFAIKETYNICLNDKSILSFSHRKIGWRTPKYQLSKDISIELITNFGYGNASYFFISLIYKDIIIKPFSDWINYEISKFSEIIRYSYSLTKGYYIKILGEYYFKPIIENSDWEDAMNYAKEACNLLLNSKNEFIKKYILEECESMVKGLENIIIQDKFEFTSPINRQKYKIDKKGHVLVEFKGEKISGALDFITKILDYNKFIKIQSFVNRIEACNKIIEPILEEELYTLKTKLEWYNSEMSIILPKYKSLSKKFKIYDKRKTDVIRQFIIDDQNEHRNIDDSEVLTVLLSIYPEYEEFQKEYNTVVKKYKFLRQKINQLILLENKIMKYNNKIKAYFK